MAFREKYYSNDSTANYLVTNISWNASGIGRSWLFNIRVTDVSRMLHLTHLLSLYLSRSVTLTLSSSISSTVYYILKKLIKINYT